MRPIPTYSLENANPSFSNPKQNLPIDLPCLPIAPYPVGAFVRILHVLDHCARRYHPTQSSKAFYEQASFSRIHSLLFPSLRHTAKTPIVRPMALPLSSMANRLTVGADVPI